MDKPKDLTIQTLCKAQQGVNVNVMMGDLKHSRNPSQTGLKEMFSHEYRTLQSPNN